MNTKSLSLAFLALLSAPLALHAVIDGVDAVPAATLLDPYFEVAYTDADAHRTVLTVGNHSDTEALAHVTLWTDAGVPAFAFDLRIDAHGAQEIDLLALFRNGTLPQSTAGGFSGCGGLLPPANLGASALGQLQRAFRGLSSTLLGGSCGGANFGENVARGYVTIDATSECTALFPNGSGYFVSGGAGIATNDNVLWGEVYTSDTGDSAAHGTPLVHLEADSANPFTDGVPGPSVGCPVPNCPPNPGGFVADYTFYSRVIGSAADNREGLPQQWLGRYDVASQSTSARIWRDPGSVAPFLCGTQPPDIPTVQIVSFDDRENPFVGPDATAPLATQEIEIEASSFLAPDFDRGFIHYNLARSASGVLGTRNQSYVSHVYDRGLLRSEAAAIPGFSPISNASSPNLPVSSNVPACSDGIDNDTDGDIDFPDDSSCGKADDISEVTECSDGVNNDGDGATDLADPDCHSARDHFEHPAFNPQCDDGIDNDGDGAIDWVADGGCTIPFPGFSDNSENSNICSDGIDNDGDGLIDFPVDPGCSGPFGIENPVCNDGLSNDADGLVDFPADPGCASASSGTEAPQCDDGISNDINAAADGLIDFPADPGCASRSFFTESPQCNDGVNNDPFVAFGGDLLIDLADPGCSSASDTTEFQLQCSDGLDNDGNGFTDFPNDPSCFDGNDNTEAASCSDLEDNDCDGLADAVDPGCENPDDLTEGPGLAPQCFDGNDNDGDGIVDFPNDPGCQSRADDVEFNAASLLQDPTAVPALSTWGLILMGLLLAGVAAVVLRGGVPNG